MCGNLNMLGSRVREARAARVTKALCCSIGAPLPFRHPCLQAVVDALLTGLSNRLIEGRSRLAVSMLANQNQNEVPPRFRKGRIELDGLANEQLGIRKLLFAGERSRVVTEVSSSESGVASK